MRWVLFVLMVLASPMCVVAQEPVEEQEDTTEYIRIPLKEYQQLRSDIITVLQSDRTNEELISSLRNENQKLRDISRSDSLLLQVKDYRIATMESLLSVYDERVKDLESGSFIDSRVLWYGLGAVSVYLGSVVLDNSVGN